MKNANIRPIPIALFYLKNVSPITPRYPRDQACVCVCVFVLDFLYFFFIIIIILDLF